MKVETRWVINKKYEKLEYREVLMTFNQFYIVDPIGKEEILEVDYAYDDEDYARQKFLEYLSFKIELQKCSLAFYTGLRDGAIEMFKKNSE